LVSRAPFKSAEYDKLVDRRPLHIQDLLKQNCTTLYADVDTIWKKSPFTEILAKNKGQADMYLVSDEKDQSKQGIAVHNFCTCFMYINPTATSSHIIGQWIQRLQGHLMTNQGPFNQVLSKDNNALKHKVTQLPYEKFPPGCSYHGLKDEACIAHANYLVGHVAKAKFLKAVAEEMHLQVDL